MTLRPLVSYDDISPRDSQPPPSTPATRRAQPPPKKRKRTSKSKQHTQTPHWDDPHESMAYLGEGEPDGGVPNEIENGELSRELTHEEIWDDSALIEAWNAAAEEYKAFHGLEKNWKKEPVHKSPLWYNVPPKPSASSGSPPRDGPMANGLAEADSRPINFDTFLPTHDASLPSGNLQTMPIPGPDYSSQVLLDPSRTMATQDEAFNRALGATYWSGYWTAIYHLQRHLAQHSHSREDEGLDPAESQTDDETELTDDLVPTQR